MIDEALKAFEMPLRQRGLSVTFAHEQDNLPHARIDREALTQAFMNLLDNAVKYSGSGKEISGMVASSGAASLRRATRRLDNTGAVRATTPYTFRATSFRFIR